MTKHLRKLTLRIKGLSWFMISEISVYSWLILLLWDCMLVHHSDDHVLGQRCSPPSSQEAREKERRRQSQYSLQGHDLPSLE